MSSILDITGHNLVWHYKDLALESGESSELFLYFQVSFNDDYVKLSTWMPPAGMPRRHPENPEIPEKNPEILKIPEKSWFFITILMPDQQKF